MDLGSICESLRQEEPTAALAILVEVAQIPEFGKRLATSLLCGLDEWNEFFEMPEAVEFIGKYY